MNFNYFSKFEMSSRQWQGFASLYVFCLILAIFGFIALLDGDLVPGFLVVAVSVASGWMIHTLVMSYLKGRNL